MEDKPEGQKFEAKQISLAAGKIFTIEGVYCRILQVVPNQRIFIVQVMTTHEVKQAVQQTAAAQNGNKCGICHGTGYAEILQDGPHKGKMAPCGCPATPPDAPKIIDECVSCDSTGKIKGLFKSKDCPDCEGAGKREVRP